VCTAIFTLLVVHLGRVDAVELAQTTPTPPAASAYEQEVSREAADFRPSTVREEGIRKSDQRQSAEAASAPIGMEPERIDRIKALVDEALAAPEEDRESERTSGAKPPQPEVDPVTARRKELRALVTEQREPSNVQDARYLNELRDEVSDTIVFGEASPAQPVGPAAEGAPSAEAAPGSYRVKPGDSLWKIAQDRYGDGYKWRRIYDANRDSLRNIDVLRVGQVLMLPNP